MKSIEEILDNYNEYETFLEDRFGVRFGDFLTEEQLKQIGFELNEEYKKNRIIKEWNKENILEQLKEDVEFAIEKMENKRGISSELMNSVVKSWLKVLEDDELVSLLEESYIDYGLSHMKAVTKKYNFNF